jgi:hypothetical protein
MGISLNRIISMRCVFVFILHPFGHLEPSSFASLTRQHDVPTRATHFPTGGTAASSIE